MKTSAIATFALAVVLAAAFQAPASATGQDPDPDAGARAALAAASPALGQAKLLVSEQYMKTHAWAHDASAAGLEPSTGIPGRIAIADGTITLAFDAPASLAGKALRLIPSDTGDGMVHWRCEAPGLPAALKPKGCE